VLRVCLSALYRLKFQNAISVHSEFRSGVGRKMDLDSNVVVRRIRMLVDRGMPVLESPLIVLSIDVVGKQY
jgi:hypothetical protein